MKHTIITISSILILMNTASCTPVLVAGAATAVGATALKEKTFGETIDDVKLSAKINYELAKDNKKLFGKVSVISHQDNVYLIGIVHNSATKTRASEIAKKFHETKKVINKIKIDHSNRYGGKDYTYDSTITAQVKTKLLANNSIHSVNYNIATCDKVVYVVGIALSQEEHDIVIETARKVSGVKDVVSFIEIRPHHQNNEN